MVRFRSRFGQTSVETVIPHHMHFFASFADSQAPLFIVFLRSKPSPSFNPKFVFHAPGRAMLNASGEVVDDSHDTSSLDAAALQSRKLVYASVIAGTAGALVLASIFTIGFVFLTSTFGDIKVLSSRASKSGQLLQGGRCSNQGICVLKLRQAAQPACGRKSAKVRKSRDEAGRGLYKDVSSLTPEE